MSSSQSCSVPPVFLCWLNIDSARIEEPHYYGILFLLQQQQNIPEHSQALFIQTFFGSHLLERITCSTVSTRVTTSTCERPDASKTGPDDGTVGIAGSSGNTCAILRLSMNTFRAINTMYMILSLHLSISFSCVAHVYVLMFSIYVLYLRSCFTYHMRRPEAEAKQIKSVNKLQSSMHFSWENAK